MPPEPTVSPSPHPTSADPSSADAAAALLAAYEQWLAEHLAITRRAGGRFLAREWKAVQRDALERLILYPRSVRRAVAALRGRIDPADDGLKPRFRASIAGRADAELAETFFSSVVRRVLGTVGVSPATEFTADEEEPAPRDDPHPPCRTYPVEGDAAEAFARMLADTDVAQAFTDVGDDARLCARAVAHQLGDDARRVRALEALPYLFYRNKGAYLAARLRMEGDETRPLLIPLVNGDAGVRADAVLTTADEVHVVFSFARSYFHVDTASPRAAIAFLRTLMPAKPLHELYTSLGFHKHGKTELYRGLMRHLRQPDARFEPAEGQKGLVMSVFTLPGYNVVFKVIRDRFGAPKDVTPSGVREKYRLVFLLDRVGRLVDAQEFEHLRLPAECFAPEVLRELREEAAATVRVEGGTVVVDHCYTERRLRPLDLYLRESEGDAAERAVVEYGSAIRDLACANIFPGDLLLKNFGVSRHGRVIFYDYDEISLLTDVRFRSIPRARSDEDEMSAEPWFSVSDGDVFPEEFLPFLVPPGPLRQAFLAAHGDLLTVRFWREMQRRQEAGEIPDFYPYPRERRLRRE